MQRWVLGCLLAASLMAAWSSSAVAGQRQGPRRFSRGSYAEYILQRDKNNRMQVREVYTGYPQRFHLPAHLYDGYPHTGSYGQPFSQPGTGF